MSSSRTAELSFVELKYCERCGGLWLRARSSRYVYCPACASRLRELPPPAREPASDGDSGLVLQAATPPGLAGPLCGTGVGPTFTSSERTIGRETGRCCQ